MQSVVLTVSVCTTVCPSQPRITSKWLNLCQWKLEPLTVVTRLSHRPYGPEHRPAEKWRSRQILHGYRAASPVSAALTDNMLRLFWCEGPRIWGGFDPAYTHQLTDTMTDFVKVVHCATTDPLQCSFSFPFLFFVPVSMRKGDRTFRTVFVTCIWTSS